MCDDLTNDMPSKYKNLNFFFLWKCSIYIFVTGHSLSPKITICSIREYTYKYRNEVKAYWLAYRFYQRTNVPYKQNKRPWDEWDTK